MNIQFSYFIVTIVCAVNLMPGGVNSYIGITLAVQYKHTVQLIDIDHCVHS